MPAYIGVSILEAVDDWWLFGSLQNWVEVEPSPNWYTLQQCPKSFRHLCPNNLHMCLGVLHLAHEFCSKAHVRLCSKCLSGMHGLNTSKTFS